MTRRPSILLPLLLAACDPNFTVSHEDLGPFRVAGLGLALDADGEKVASAAVWSGLSLYHEASPTLSWTLDGVALGEGYDVLVPGPGELGLTATSAEGEARIAVVTVADPPPPVSLTRSAVTLGEDLSLAARRAATAVEVADTVEQGEVARLSLAFDATTDPTDTAAFTATWFMAEGRGTALELDDMSADLFAEEIRWDEGVVDTRTPVELGVDLGLLHSLALIRDGAGSGSWIWADAAVDAPGAWLRHEGRLLLLTQDDAESVAADAANAGWVLVSLAASDDSSGISLTDAVATPSIDGAIEGEPDLSGQDLLSCAPPGQPFRLAWIAEGRCALPDVIGATVLLEVW